MTRTAEPVTRTRSWTGLSCPLAWRAGDVDAFLVARVRPLLEGLRTSGQVADWYFERDGGRLRLRLRGADWCTVRALRTDLAKAAARFRRPLTGPDQAVHGDVREDEHQPDADLFGGPSALPPAEDAFCRSTELALTTLEGAGDAAAKLTAAAEVVMATAMALGLDRRAAASWLRRHASAWRTAEGVRPPALPVHREADRMFAARALDLDGRWDRVARTRDHALVRWTNAVRRARRAVEGAAGAAAPVADGWQAVWGAQVQLLLNRLGLTPEEERRLCLLVAASALSPRGPEPFFADGVAAADRRYLEASRLRPDLPGQRPESVEIPLPRLPGPAGEPIALPAPDALDRSLSEVLRTRATGRGALTGPIGARDLATLLWQAHAALPDEVWALDGTPHARRPYPSAGPAYAARLAVLVRDVPGVRPGRYTVDEVTRTLSRTGPAPAEADLRGMCRWFGEHPVDQGGIDVAASPAVLGLYLDLGALRARYGLRGLRFGFAEAGHLAQNLALVAAAAGLGLGMVGGFYDDVANDVFGLDGVDHALAYLLPVGRLSADRS